LLDSDSYLGRTGLAKLVARMQSDSSLGILGCRIMNWYSGDIDQWFYPQSYETMGDIEFETYSFSGAGALLRTSAVKQAGGFWDDLFIYNEEVDLSIGVIRAGYRILYVPNVPVFHRSSKNGRVPTARFFYYQIRNWIWILYRHYPFWQRSLRVSLLSVVYVIKGLRAGYLKSCLGGILDGLRGTRWIGHFHPKLTAEQIRKLSMLNRRWKVRVEGRT
jgi:GT2 family glycosyltransferase